MTYLLTDMITDTVKVYQVNTNTRARYHTDCDMMEIHQKSEISDEAHRVYLTKQDMLSLAAAIADDLVGRAVVADAIDQVREHYIKTQDRPMRGSGHGDLTPAGAVGQLPHDFVRLLYEALKEEKLD